MHQTKLIILILFITINVSAQKNYTNSISKRAQLFANAKMNYNFKEILDLTYPKLIEIVSKDSLLTQFSDEMVLLKQEGLRYKSITFGDIQKIISQTDNMNYVIPQEIIKYNSRGEFHTKTYLFATSIDKGKTWYFLTDEQFIKHQRQLFPKLEKRYRFPEKMTIFMQNNKFNALDKPN